MEELKSHRSHKPQPLSATLGRDDLGRHNLTMEDFQDHEVSSDFGDSISQGSKQSARTFRDTEIEGDTASSLMRIQNLTSIVNDPKRDSFMKYSYNSLYLWM
jgi:hypothetical protein